ncbi:MAG: hypothetical protein Q9163_003714 [Psora crenata]
MHFTLPHTASFCALRPIFASLLAIASLFFCGYPEEHWEWSAWSRALSHIGFKVFPPGAELYRFWSTIGAQLFTLSIILSPSLQKALSHRFLLWLGSISFPVYLLHGPLIRSMLAGLLFGYRHPIRLYTKNLDGSVAQMWDVIPSPEIWMYALALPVFFATLGVTSHFWNKWVDPWFAFIAAKAEERMCPRISEAQRLVELRENGLPKPNGLVR